MGKIRLIRHADEGFVNCTQSHNTVEGCYAFIQQEGDSLLIYQSEFHKENPHLINRQNHSKQEIWLPCDTLVWVKNKRLATKKEDIYFNEAKDFVMIPEEPIQKERMINGEPFPLSMDLYVKVPLSFAKEQLDRLYSFYKWIKSEVENENEISINTKVINYYESIVDILDIQREK